jgi:hypothetical protein
MKKHIVAALIASVTVISGAQAGIPVAMMQALNGLSKRSAGQNVSNSGRTR